MPVDNTLHIVSRKVCLTLRMPLETTPRLLNLDGEDYFAVLLQ